MNLDDFSYITQDGKDVVLELRVIPNAQETKLTGLYGDALKIHLNAQAVDGKANKELVKFLSKVLEVPKSFVIVDFGKTSKNKRVRILNITKQEVANRFFVLL